MDLSKLERSIDKYDNKLEDCHVGGSSGWPIGMGLKFVAWAFMAYVHAYRERTYLIRNTDRKE